MALKTEAKVHDVDPFDRKPIAKPDREVGHRLVLGVVGARPHDDAELLPGFAVTSRSHSCFRRK